MLTVVLQTLQILRFNTCTLPALVVAVVLAYSSFQSMRLLPNQDNNQQGSVLQQQVTRLKRNVRVTFIWTHHCHRLGSTLKLKKLRSYPA